LLAQRILQERGVAVSRSELDRMREDRMQALKKNKWNISLPLTAALTCFGIGFFILQLACWSCGTLTGWYIWKGKRTLPHGEKSYAFSPKARDTGMVLFAVGCILVFTSLVLYYKSVF